MTWRGQRAGRGRADAAFPTPPVVPDHPRHAGQGRLVNEQGAEPALGFGRRMGGQKGPSALPTMGEMAQDTLNA